MKFLLPLIFCFYTATINAQYIPNGWNYGLGAISTILEEQRFGVGAKVEYASTCYTSYIGAYEYILSGDGESLEGYHDFSFGIHTILFNFDPTYITVGAGYMLNTARDFDEKDKEAILFFKTGDINHGLVLKLRALIQINMPMRMYIEYNAKSLGRRYDTVGVGLLYDFDLD